MSTLAVVTGASKGIGRALALALAARDVRVLGVGRSADELATVKAARPDRIDVVAADISTPGGRERIVAALPPGAAVTHLVNNAAVMTPTGLLMDTPWQAWQHQVATNLGAPLFVIQALLPRLRGARIVNVTNLSRGRVVSGLGSYASTKAALFTLTSYLREELAAHDIGVTSAYPGFVDTPLKRQLEHLDDTVPGAKLARTLVAAGTFMPPATTAAFLAWLLLDVPRAEFVAQDLWSVYDEAHRARWIANHHLPLPG